MNNRLKYILPSVVLFMVLSCAKEYSYEGGARPVVLADTLAIVSTGCAAITPVGNYMAGVPLTSLHRLETQVNVLRTGYYSFSTDTVNGIYFFAAGNFATAGNQPVVLQATGTPLSIGTNTYHLKGNGLVCAASISVIATADIAVFTLGSATGECLGTTVSGNYISTVPLTISNALALSANVTRIGSYAISTPLINGIRFSATGTFTNTGIQTINLQGSGTPVAGGVFNYTFQNHSAACSFTVTVQNVSTDDYFPRTANSNWTYEIDNNINDTARFFVSPGSMLASGNMYQIFMVTRGSTIDSSGYYRRSGNEYYRYMDIGDFIGFNAPLWGEYKFLDIAAPAGTNWKSSMYNGMITIAGFPPHPMIVRFSTTILSKNTSLSVTTSAGSSTYADVITTEEKYEQLQGSSWVDITSQVGSFKKYYAKNIGMIKYEALNGTGQVTATVTIRRFTVY